MSGRLQMSTHCPAGAHVSMPVAGSHWAQQLGALNVSQSRPAGQSALLRQTLPSLAAALSMRLGCCCGCWRLPPADVLLAPDARPVGEHRSIASAAACCLEDDGDLLCCTTAGAQAAWQRSRRLQSAAGRPSSPGESSTSSATREQPASSASWLVALSTDAAAAWQ